MVVHPDDTDNKETVDPTVQFRQRGKNTMQYAIVVGIVNVDELKVENQQRDDYGENTITK